MSPTVNKTGGPFRAVPMISGEEASFFAPIQLVYKNEAVFHIMPIQLNTVERVKTLADWLNVLWERRDE